MGRDKTLSLTALIEKALGRVIPQSVEEYDEIRTYRMGIAEKLVDTAYHSKDDSVVLAYIKEIADRTEGKPKQYSDITSGGEPIRKIEVEVIDPLTNQNGVE